MLSTTEIAIFLTLGVIFTGGLAVLAYWAKQRPALLAAYALIAVSFLFVGFAIRADNAATWIGFEMTGVAIFGTLAGLAIVGSSWFVVAGLALHPVWALYIHYFGAPRSLLFLRFFVVAEKQIRQRPRRAVEKEASHERASKFFHPA